MKLDRYQRHSLIDWFSQDELQGYTFAVIGCGAVGNELAKNLTLLGVGKICLFDFDKIEIHNLTRSVLFRESDVGKNKVEVAAERIRELDNNVNVEAFHGDFWEFLNISTLADYDCIFCCVDNFEARIKLNQICRIASVNLINTGIDSKYAVVEVYPFAKSQNAACYECNLPESAYNKIQERYSCGWLKRVAYVERKIPTTIITSSISAGIATSSGLNLLRDSDFTESKRVLFDTFSGRTTVSHLTRSATCPACDITKKKIVIASTKNKLDDSSLLGVPMCDDLTIITSDPILVSLRCANCEPNENDAQIIFEKATNYDSTISTCSQCGKDSVTVEIADSFLFSELIERFSGRNIPAKFVRVETEHENIFFELENEQ